MTAALHPRLWSLLLLPRHQFKTAHFSQISIYRNDTYRYYCLRVVVKWLSRHHFLTIDLEARSQPFSIIDYSNLAETRNFPPSTVCFCCFIICVPPLWFQVGNDRAWCGSPCFMAQEAWCWKYRLEFVELRNHSG